jgi:hypothetical protein
MAATEAAFGIADAIAATLAQSIEVTREFADVAEIVAKDATFGAAHGFDPVVRFSVKVKDSTDVEPGVGAAGLEMVSGGKTLILNVKDMQKADDYPEAEYSGNNYPGAS